MILSPNLTLQVVLTAAKTTTDMDATVAFKDYNREGRETKPGPFRTTTNGTGAKTLLAAPQQDFIREVMNIYIYNIDTADKTVVLQTTDGTTVALIIKILVPTLKSLMWSRYTGFYVTT